MDAALRRGRPRGVQRPGHRRARRSTGGVRAARGQPVPQRPGARSAGALHWDVLGLYREVLDGLRAAAREAGALGRRRHRLLGRRLRAARRGRRAAAATRSTTATRAPTGCRTRSSRRSPPPSSTRAPACRSSRSTRCSSSSPRRAPRSSRRRARLLLDPGPARLLADRRAGRRGDQRVDHRPARRDARGRGRPTWPSALGHRRGPAARRCATPGRCSGTCATDVGLHRVGRRVWTVGSHDTASAVVAVPAAGPDFAYISCGTWSLVGVELDRPVLTEESRAANFTNEAGVDGTVRYLRNVMGLWVLPESLRTWNEAGLPADLPDLLAAAAGVPALTTVVDLDGPDVPAARRHARPDRRGGRPDRADARRSRRPRSSAASSTASRWRTAGRSGRRRRSRAGRVDVVHVVGGGVAQRAALPAHRRRDRPARGRRAGRGDRAGQRAGAGAGRRRAVRRACADLRAVGARGLDLRRYEPGATGGPTDRQWAAAAARLLTACARCRAAREPRLHASRRSGEDAASAWRRRRVQTTFRSGRRRLRASGSGGTSTGTRYDRRSTGRGSSRGPGDARTGARDRCGRARASVRSSCRGLVGEPRGPRSLAPPGPMRGMLMKGFNRSIERRCMLTRTRQSARQRACRCARRSSTTAASRSAAA